MLLLKTKLKEAISKKPLTLDVLHLMLQLHKISHGKIDVKNLKTLATILSDEFNRTITYSDLINYYSLYFEEEDQFLQLKHANLL